MGIMTRCNTKFMVFIKEVEIVDMILNSHIFEIKSIEMMEFT